MSDTAATIREALDAGLNAQALDVARGAMAESAPAAEIRYLGALASARLGATGEAEKWLAGIDREPLGRSPLAVEVWSLAGRVAKERFAASRDRTSAAAREQAKSAIACYQQAFALGGAPYPAVNAATMAMLCGDGPLARTLAQQALAAAGAKGDHWQLATAGEALFLLGRTDEARSRYAEAHRLAGNRFGDVASMRRQLLLIGSDAAHALLEVLPAPRVIAFSGHMIDRPDRATARFPASLEPRVRTMLRDTIARFGPSLGYAQAANGADILFLEAMQDAGMQTQIVLPFPPQQFVETSVSFAGDAWTARFERGTGAREPRGAGDRRGLPGRRRAVRTRRQSDPGHGVPARPGTRDAAVDADGQRPGSRELVGGTASTARIWTRTGGQIENIDLAALRGDAAPAARRVERPAMAAAQSARRRSLKSLLFADVSGFSKMPEQYAPDFAELFLGSCKSTIDALEHRPVHANTHGDGLFLVFERPSHAAEFAVRLQQAIAKFDWPALGLPAETGVRIALHTGPLFRIFDPVTGRITFYGTHVNRAARLEPVVQPHHIFVTEEFAASLVAEDQDRFTCDYIGTMQLAKRFGDARLYRLRLTNED